MVKYGFNKSQYDSCFYLKDIVSGKTIYLLLYVDDMFTARPN